MAVVAPLPFVNTSNLEKIESFLNDTAYREALESSSNYNTRLCLERRLRMPFLDSQTGVAQNHSALFMAKRQRLPGLLPGQIYSYPRARWRKKRRQYLTLHSRAFARAADSMLDGEGDMHNISQVENPALQDTDSKDSQLLKDEVSKEWFYDEQDMLEMEGYDEPDADSDFDYEESYSKRRKSRKNASKTRGVDSPNTPRRGKGSGRGRKKANHSYDPIPGDTDKPFGCERTPRRGRQSAANNPPPPPPPALPPSQQSQLPSQQPPSLPPNPPPPPVQMPPDDPPMPVLVPEKKIKLPAEPPTTVLLPPEPQKDKAAPSPYCDFCLGDARENKKTGNSEELVSCSDCGRSGKARLETVDKSANNKKSRKKKTI